MSRVCFLGFQFVVRTHALEVHNSCSKFNQNENEPSYMYGTELGSCPLWVASYSYSRFFSQLTAAATLKVFFSIAITVGVTKYFNILTNNNKYISRLDSILVDMYAFYVDLSSKLINNHTKSIWIWSNHVKMLFKQKYFSLKQRLRIYIMLMWVFIIKINNLIMVSKKHRHFPLNLKYH